MKSHRSYNFDPMMARASAGTATAPPPPIFAPPPPARTAEPTLWTPPAAPPSPTYGGSPPYQRSSDTSRAAAASVADVATTDAALVLGFIKSKGEYGGTQPEAGIFLARHRGLPDDNSGCRLTAGARCREMELRGYLVKTKHRRPTSSGRTATVYVWTGKAGDGGNDNEAHEATPK